MVDVTVTAYFHNPTWQALWEAARKLIEGAAPFILTQQEAPDASTARYRLAEIINNLLTAGTRNAGLGEQTLGAHILVGHAKLT